MVFILQVGSENGRLHVKNKQTNMELMMHDMSKKHVNDAVPFSVLAIT